MMTRYNICIAPGVYKNIDVLTLDFEMPWDTRTRLIKQVLDIAKSKKAPFENIVFHGLNSVLNTWVLRYDFLPELRGCVVTEEMDRHFQADRALRWAKLQLKNCFADKNSWGVK